MPNSTIKPPAAAQLIGVRKAYGKTLALDGVSLALSQGEVLALLGPNGAGKSTVVGLLLGLLEANAGQTQLLGHAPQAIAVRRQSGVMLQSAGIADAATVHELLELTRSYYPAPRPLDECLGIAGLGDIAGRRYGTLSGGQQRRVQFAMAICGAPRVLFLDEPTTGLDIDARQRLWQAIRRLRAEGCAILLTTHYLEEAEALADRVAVLDRGRIVAQGTVDDIRAHVGQRRIVCRTALDAAAVAQWPGVLEARREDARLQLVVEQAEPVLRQLLCADASLADLEVRRAGLGEAFLALTRGGDNDTSDHKQAA